MHVHVIGCDGFGQSQSVYVVRQSSQDPDQLKVSLREYKLGHLQRPTLERYKKHECHLTCVTFKLTNIVAINSLLISSYLY